MKHLILIITSSVMLLLVSCGDFLEEHSQNMAYVEQIEDLDELLIGEAYLKGGYSLDSADANMYYYWSQLVNTTGRYYPYIHLMDDDVTEYLSGNITATMEKNYLRKKAAKVYTWQADPMFDSEMLEIYDNNWTSGYQHIAALNSIISTAEEMRATEPDQDLVNRVQGEAYFLRAQFYFWMANIYGKPYCKATANEDVCIPLKTTSAVEDRYFSRSPMQEVYQQMVSDLQHSCNLLRNNESSTKYRANQAAAFALLSRVYLYMEEYDLAANYADSVISKGYALLDFNHYKAGESAVYAGSTETIFTHGPNIMAVILPPDVKMGINYISSGYSASDELMNSYAPNDLRRKAFFIDRTPNHGSGYRCVKTKFKAEEVSDYMAIRLPEVYLNKAEALAMSGKDKEAIATLNELRTHRFAPADLTSINLTGEELVNFIRDERRRELCFEGHRWFDLRRYAVNTKYPFTKSIRHAVLAGDNGMTYTEAVYELKPYPQDKAAYMLPIPPYAIEFNMGNLTNEVRPERNPIVE